MLAPAGILREPFYKIFQNVGPCGHIKGALLQNSQNSRRVGRVVSRRVASVAVSSVFTISLFIICLYVFIVLICFILRVMTCEQIDRPIKLI